jgi:hypothetical protein
LLFQSGRTLRVPNLEEDWVGLILVVSREISVTSVSRLPRLEGA